MVALKNITRALCTTPACLEIADYYVKNLAPNYKDIDPCTNFEEMVCGGWRDRYDIPSDQTSNDAISLIEQKVDDELRIVLEGQYPVGSKHSHFSPRNLHARDLSVDQQNFETMKAVYNSCMDEDSIKKLGISPIVDLIGELRKTFGRDDWSAPILFAQRLGATSLTSVYVTNDFDKPDLQVVVAEPTVGLGLQMPDFYVDTTMLTNDYVPVLANILRAVHPNDSSATNFTEQARRLVQFETNLAALLPPDDFDFVEALTRVPTAKIDALVPRLGVSKIIAALAPPGIPSVEVLVYAPFLANLTKVIDAAPRSTVELLFVWRTILASRAYVVADEIFDPLLKLRRKLYGDNSVRPPTPRWKTCVGFVGDSVGWILSRFFIENTFSARDREISNQIVADVREVYIQKFKTVPWMDESTRTKAIEKIDLLEQKIGYPTENPNITDPETIRNLYGGLTVTSSYFRNAMSATNKSIIDNFARLGKATDRKGWGISFPTIVNAFYKRQTNEIDFPAGILQAPVFGGDYPSAVNYGAFGAVAGHEASHGFDINGGKFDGTGRLVNWWSDEVTKEYKKREQCFISQFNNITVSANDKKNVTQRKYKLDGRKTLGENEADSAGIVAAFDSWKLRRKLNGDKTELALPGLEDWTDEQLFFLAYGNFWCGKYSDDAMQIRLKQDVHAPNAARVQGTTANSRAFKEAFGCKVKEPTCELW